MIYIRGYFPIEKTSTYRIKYHFPLIFRWKNPSIAGATSGWPVAQEQLAKFGRSALPHLLERVADVDPRVAASAVRCLKQHTLTEMLKESLGMGKPRYDVCVNIYTYMYICICVYICIYAYIYIYKYRI